MKKFLVFKGQSQYDVLSTSVINFVNAAQRLDYKVALVDMNLNNSDDYLRIVDKFKPDFTLGFNPVGYPYGEKWHMEETSIPHIVQLGDSPYHHMYNRVLSNPNHPLVHTVVSEKEYVNDFKDFGSDNISFRPFLRANDFSRIDLNNKIYPLVYFGSYFSEESILNWVDGYVTNKNLLCLIKEFLGYINGFIEVNLTILPDRLPVYLRDFLEDKFNKIEVNFDRLMLYLFPIVDRYYNSVVRGKVLKGFAESGMDMYVFGRDDTKKLLGSFSNVRVFPPVSYTELLNIVKHSKIHLNITPTKFSMHERISNTLACGTLLCTNIMPNLFENYPDVLNSSIVYDLSNIYETVQLLKGIVNNYEDYNEIITEGQILAKKEFTYEKDLEFLMNIYKRQFLKG